MNESTPGFSRIPFPTERKLVVDWTRLGMGSPRMLGLLEVDVTEARRRLRAHQEHTGEKLSFTAWIASCLGKAVARHPEVHAYRDLWGHLVLFEEVDLTVSIEIDYEGRRFPLAHILRGAERRGVRSLHDEIRELQREPKRAVPDKKRKRNFRLLLGLPGPLRRLIFRIALANPLRRKRMTGTVALSAVGMMGSGTGWAVAAPTGFSLFVLAGSIATKPAYVGGRLEPRELLHLTLNFDHDVVDGAPAARFAAELVRLMESADGLDEIEPAVPSDESSGR